MKPKQKLIRMLSMERNLKRLEELGYEPIQQKCYYQYKDKNFMFYPTTGSVFDEYTRLKYKISDLPARNSLLVESRPIIGKYGQEYEKEVYLFSEFSLPKNQLPSDEQMENSLWLL